MRRIQEWKDAGRDRYCVIMASPTQWWVSLASAAERVYSIGRGKTLDAAWDDAMSSWSQSEKLNAKGRDA